MIFGQSEGGRECFFCVGCRMLTAGGSCMQRNLSRSCFPFGGLGVDSTKCDPSHHLMQVETYPHIYWCRVCGALSSKQAKLLLCPCRGKPSKWGEYVLACLLGGYLPKTIFQPDRVWVGDSVHAICIDTSLGDNPGGALGTDLGV